MNSCDKSPSEENSSLVDNSEMWKINSAISGASDRVRSCYDYLNNLMNEAKVDDEVA